MNAYAQGRGHCGRRPDRGPASATTSLPGSTSGRRRPGRRSPQSLRSTPTRIGAELATIEPTCPAAMAASRQAVHRTSQPFTTSFSGTRQCAATVPASWLDVQRTRPASCNWIRPKRTLTIRTTLLLGGLPAITIATGRYPRHGTGSGAVGVERRIRLSIRHDPSRTRGERSDRRRTTSGAASPVSRSAMPKAELELRACPSSPTATT